MTRAAALLGRGMSAEFLLTALIVCIIPGTGVVYTLSVALGGGLRRAAVAAVGCTLGIVPHIIASLLGLAAILHASATLYEGLRVLGVLYLFYMAVQAWRAKGTLAVGARAPASAMRLIGDGILLNILNPKLTLFFVAFLPQFVPADVASPALAMVGLAAVFMALTLATFLAYGACAALARDAVLARPAVMVVLRRSFAAAFGLLGLRLALADR